MPGPTMDAAARDAVFATVLAEHPDAFVSAVTVQGLFAPLPDELRRSGLRPLEGPSSALGLIVGEDHPAVVDAWHRAVTEGAAECLVRPRAAPGVVARMLLVDTTHRFGLYTCCITGLEGPLGALGADPVRPRMVTVRKDQTAVITAADPGIARLLGWTAEELAGRRAIDLVHPDDHQRAIASWMDLLTVPDGGARRVRLRHLHRDGRAVWFEITNHSFLGTPGDPHVVGEMLDISDEMAAEEALRASELRLRRLTEALPMSILQIDADRVIVYQNARVARTVGTAEGDVLDGARLAAGVAPGDLPKVSAALDAVLRDGTDADLEYGFRHPDTGLRRVDAKVRALAGDDGRVTGAIICLTDVTDAVRMREELHRQATYDALTGCRSRAATLTALEEALALPTGGRGVAVVFVDLNEFKQVNDRHGHAAGDRLLTHVGDLLRGAVRDGDVVGRFGGDEFVVVCRDVAGRPQARRIAEALATAVAADSAALRFDGVRILPRASIGVSWARPGTADADALVARADAAMYRAKKTRAGRVALQEAA
ncbi:sensor domain-containing diguanylate cyclase [Dactylosporangium sp. NPDC049742]|uniref:sensor domain-containing diguanylate cyclase n=1 Tax=Dactylosporangium sp. NPDC049742 TaxID=3154737 RepID=UPI0034169481